MERISIDDFKKVDMRVGVIVAAERVPETDKLIKLTVDLGEAGPRTIVSGIATYFPNAEDLVGKRVPFVANLEPRTMRGIESNGMILAAAHEGSFSLLAVDDSIPAGTRLS